MKAELSEFDGGQEEWDPWAGMEEPEDNSPAADDPIRQPRSRYCRGVSDFGARVLEEHLKRNGDFPVVAKREYLRSAKLVKRGFPLAPGKAKRVGSVIREFSDPSRRAMEFVIENSDIVFASMLTITYPADFPRDGLRVKYELNRMQKWLVRHVEGVQGVWFLEFQKRGAPHFHFLLNVDLGKFGLLVRKKRTGVARGQKSPSFRTCEEMQQRAGEAWFRIVGSGDEKHLRAGVCWEVLEKSDAAQRYAAKHAAKVKQKQVPKEFQNVGRFWGRLGGLKPPQVILETSYTTCDAIKDFGCEIVSGKGRLRTYLPEGALYLHSSPSPL